MLELLHLIELVHWIAWAIRHPREARARVATIIRAVIVFILAAFGSVVVASVAIDALRLEGTTATNASVAATVLSLAVGAVALWWYLRRRRAVRRPVELTPSSAEAEN